MSARRDRGQAAVEFAIVVPVVVVLVLGIVQVAVVAAHRLAVEHLARAAARAASVSSDPASAASGFVADASGLEPLDVVTSTTASTVTVTVAFTDPTSVPVIGAVVADVRLTASATMPLEPP